MNEQELKEQLTANTAWIADLPPADVSGDVQRGRARLRRRRAALGVTACSALAVAALGFSTLTSASPEGVPAAAQPTATAPTGELGEQMSSVVRKHVDPQNHFVDRKHPSFTLSNDDAGTGGDNPYYGTFLPWVEDGGTGQLSIGLFTKSPEAWMSRYCSPSTFIVVHYRCAWQTQADGKRVLVGHSSTDERYNGRVYQNLKGYAALYVWPDGRVTVVQVNGNADNVVVRKPVRDPSITIDQVIAAATDPALVQLLP